MPFLLLNRLFFCFALLLWTPSKGAAKPVEIKKSALEISAEYEHKPRVRVAITRSSEAVRISSDSPFHVFDGEGRALFQGKRLIDTAVRASKQGVYIGSQNFTRTPVIVDVGDGKLRMGQRSYRDSLEFFQAPNGRLLVINEVALDDYLKGVLPLEANPGWKAESLKAQAVASRTYALFKIIQNRAESYAVSDDVASQVYGGMTHEKPTTNQAVDLTRGEILTFDGKIFPAYFHSTCSGHTTRADFIWPVEKHPALQGGECGFCTESQHTRWRNAWTPAEIKKALALGGHPLPDIRGVHAVDIDASGRARSFEIQYATGKIKVPSNDFRLWMGPMKFKSTRIQSIRFEGGRFVFQGRGWGHGVGMCQYGIKKMGELGYTYKQILDYYFPGAVIKKLKSQAEPPSEESAQGLQS